MNEEKDISKKEFIVALIWFGIAVVGLVGMAALIFRLYSEIYRVVFIEGSIGSIDLLIGCCIVCGVIAASYSLIKLYANMVIVSIEDKIKERIK